MQTAVNRKLLFIVVRTWQQQRAFLTELVPGLHGHVSWTQQRVPAFARHRATNRGTMSMRKAILGAASALALVSPAAAADLAVPRYSEVPSYEHDYRTGPPVVVEEPAPSEIVVVRRPVIVAPPPVVVDEYPVYAAPRVYAAPPVYAYAGPVWRGGWGHRGHFHGRW